MPIIGITPVSRQEKREYRIRFDYPELIQKAGGTPILLPLSSNLEDLETYLTMCDGFLFTGGSDIQPSYYGETALPETDAADKARDEMELFLMKEAYKRSIPCFGICRGCQLMNIARGGDLYQDLPSMRKSDISHQMQEPYQRYVHTVIFPENSLLENILDKKELQVNSIHHQGLRKLGEGLEVLAYAPDGLVEAIRDPQSSCFLSVQWHPEFVFRQEEDSVRLLRYFVEKCNHE